VVAWRVFQVFDTGCDFDNVEFHQNSAAKVRWNPFAFSLAPAALQSFVLKTLYHGVTLGGTPVHVKVVGVRFFATWPLLRILRSRH